MAVRATEISDLLKQQIQGFSDKATVTNVGQVITIGDGVATVHGLSQAMQSELVEFTKDGTYGLVLNLGEDAVSVIVMGDYLNIEEGDEVRTTGAIASVPVGDALLGRVVNALGQPIDGKGPIQTDKTREIERIAPGVIKRQDVDTPLQTGVKSIDAMTPIGRGQRQLILGDRQTGKSVIATDMIINQRDSGVKCIYVAIGQKQSQIAQLSRILEENGALDHTIIVVASAADPAPLQYIAPFAGTAMGEEFMENGQDALIIYDDLTKHAWAYRQVSLLMRRPPGREAFPGDIFYSHSRLLERAARLNEENGGGSLTALPVIETQAGDVSAYIPTNVISITDGQIFLQTDLFNQGQRPAVNAGISVSRVGGNAQIKAMRQVAGKMRLDLAQYRELAAFAQFASDLDKATRDQLTRGEKVTMILRQPQFSPLSVENQVAIIWTATNGWLDDIDSSRLGEFETGFYRFLESTHKDLLPAIAKEKALSDELTKQLESAVKEYREQSGFGKADDSAKAEAKPAEPAKAEAKPAESAKAETKTDASEAPAKKATPSKKSASAKKSASKSDKEAKG